MPQGQNITRRENQKHKLEMAQKKLAKLNKLKQKLASFDVHNFKPINYDVPLDGISQNENLKINNILSDSEMSKLGFYQHRPCYWVYFYNIKSTGLEFMVTIDIENNKIIFEINDPDYGQPYDYQKYLEKATSISLDYAMPLLVHAQVQKEMQRLVNAGILKGFVKNDYI